MHKMSKRTELLGNYGRHGVTLIQSLSFKVRADAKYTHHTSNTSGTVLALLEQAH